MSALVMIGCAFLLGFGCAVLACKWWLLTDLKERERRLAVRVVREWGENLYIPRVRP